MEAAFFESNLERLAALFSGGGQGDLERALERRFVLEVFDYGVRRRVIPCFTRSLVVVCL